MSKKKKLTDLAKALRDNLKRRKGANHKKENKNNLNSKLKISVFLLFPLISSCSDRHYSNGYVAASNELSKIQLNKSTEGDVLQILGEPTTKSLYGDKEYFYMQRNYKQKLFFSPKLVKQQVISISFASNNTVKKITNYNTENAIDIKYDNEITPFEGNKIGPFEQILGNFGRFSSQAQKAARK